MHNAWSDLAGVAGSRGICRPRVWALSKSKHVGRINFCRFFHKDAEKVGYDYTRLSQVWIPTVAKAKGSESQEDAHSLLLRAGFLRQVRFSERSR